jgi:tRNA dimethylallyltransferase
MKDFCRETVPAFGTCECDLIVVTGPTASGKTEAAVELALKLGTEVISTDSMQVYRHLSIGTAKPSADELRGVPYHLIDCVDPDYQYNLGDFVRDADAIIARLHASGKTPVLCGGTGMYLRGLIHGIFSVESRNEVVRKDLAIRADAGELPTMYEEMMRVDPGAGHIKPNDRQRIIRALEVFLVTGRPITQYQTQQASPPRYRARTFILSLPRTELYERINRRVDRMMTAGLLDEVRLYLSRGYSRTNPAVKALGYAEIISHLEGQMSLGDALEAMKKKTRNYAKRQTTWFRSMRGSEIIEANGRGRQDICDTILARLEDCGFQNS